MKRIVFILVTFFVVSHFFVYGAKVSPVKFNLTLAKGSKETFNLNIIGSKGPFKQNLVISPSDLSMDRKGALLFERKIGSAHSAVEWITFGRTELSVFDGKKESVKFTISVPRDAVPGEYYSIIFVEPKEDEVIDYGKNREMNVRVVVGVLVLIDVPGRTYVKSGQIPEVKVLETDERLKISSTFQNTGNIHLNVTAEAVIKSADGRNVFGKCELKGLGSSITEIGNYFVFPDSSKLDFEGVLNKQLPTGDYLVETSFNYGYDFKKARKTEKFSINRLIPIDEETTEFLGIKTKELTLVIPPNSRRSEVVTVSNLDYRPLAIKVTSNDWITVLPNDLILKPGESRNLRVTIIPNYEGSKIKEGSIPFITDRGKDLNLKIVSKIK